MRERGGFIWLWWGEPRAELPPLPWFEDIDESFPHGTFRSHWTVHYSRAIENQLDVVHLPFVHHNTIGRGNRTLVEGPVTTWSDDGMRLWVYNKVDDGSRPRRPEEIPAPTDPPRLYLHLPNVWQNWLSDDLRIVAVFAPIDDGNTMLYIRFYQRVVRVPLLRELFCAVGAWGNSVVANQDRRVVITQRPVKSWLRMDEKLIQGDRPIIEYRRRRQALIDAVGDAHAR